MNNLHKGFIGAQSPTINVPWEHTQRLQRQSLSGGVQLTAQTRSEWLHCLFMKNIILLSFASFQTFTGWWIWGAQAANTAAPVRSRRGGRPWILDLLSFVRLPSQDGSLSLFIFYIFPTSFQRQWAAFLVAWCPLPAFRSCFVAFTQRSNVLLMKFWGRKWSPFPIPPPS